MGFVNFRLLTSCLQDVNNRVTLRGDDPLRAVFELLLGSIALSWADGVVENKTRYSIGNIDVGFCIWTDRVLGHSREPRYFAGHNPVAGTAGRA